MLDPKEVTTIERSIKLLEYNSKDKAPIKMLKALLEDTEEDINDSAPIDVMGIIPKVLKRLKKELGYGIPNNISNGSVQSNKDRAFDYGAEWDESKQTEREKLATK